jgi:hypothetical protein
MRPRLRVIQGGRGLQCGGPRKPHRGHLRVIRVCEWLADVHLFVYPLLFVLFVWWLAYGGR